MMLIVILQYQPRKREIKISSCFCAETAPGINQNSNRHFRLALPIAAMPDWLHFQDGKDPSFHFGEINIRHSWFGKPACRGFRKQHELDDDRKIATEPRHRQMIQSVRGVVFWIIVSVSRPLDFSRFLSRPFSQHASRSPVAGYRLPNVLGD